MILKKIRETKNLSQEQLAMMAGLNVRTIQRIEAGNKASIESLKSIAAALEVDIKTLEQEITVIDKTTSKWQALPLWLKASFWGSNIPLVGASKRQHYIRAELITAIAGIIFCIIGIVDKTAHEGGLVLVAAAYGISLMTRAGDKFNIW